MHLSAGASDDPPLAAARTLLVLVLHSHSPSTGTCYEFTKNTVTDPYGIDYGKLCSENCM